MPVTLQEPDATRSAVGTGVYALSDLRAYVSFDGDLKDGRRVLPWLTRVLLPVARTPHHADYNFADLISLFVVRQLLNEGVKARNIRIAEEYLRRKWHAERPFLRGGDLRTDGKHIWVDGDVIPGQIESADQWGQQALLEPIRASLRRVHYDDGSAAYWMPTAGVLVDPRVQFGEPVVAGTRLPTAALAATAAKIGIEAAAANLAVPVEAARIAMHFEDRLEQARNN